MSKVDDHNKKHHGSRGKELVIRALTHSRVDHPPWVPFTGVHAGSLKGYTATEILTNSDKLLECLHEVKRLYFPDGQPVLFDLQVEAEILGCKLRWADKAPPSVETHPLAATQAIPSTIPSATAGRLPMILDVMERAKVELGDDVALFGLVTGPLTLASHLRGTKLFVDMLRNKEYTMELLQYATDVGLAMCDHYIDAGMDVIAIVDPVVSQVSPRAFTSLLEAPFKAMFDHVRQRNRLGAFFVCGDATKNLEPMCGTRPDAIFVDENIDMVAARDVLFPRGITLGGNIPLTTVMLHGTQQDNMKYVVDLIDALGKDNLVIAPGCDMPYDVPVANVVGVAQAVHEYEHVRVVLETYNAQEIELDVALPDYALLARPLVEVFTIDSATCAACSYMKSMAYTARERFGDRVDIVEYKWTERENIARAKKMGVRHLPCILIDGELKYSSIIPNQEEYFNELEKSLRARVHQRHHA